MWSPNNIFLIAGKILPSVQVEASGLMLWHFGASPIPCYSGIPLVLALSAINLAQLLKLPILVPPWTVAFSSAIQKGLYLTPAGPCENV